MLQQLRVSFSCRERLAPPACHSCHSRTCDPCHKHLVSAHSCHQAAAADCHVGAAASRQVPSVGAALGGWQVAQQLRASLVNQPCHACVVRERQLQRSPLAKLPFQYRVAWFVGRWTLLAPRSLLPYPPRSLRVTTLAGPASGTAAQRPPRMVYAYTDLHKLAGWVSQSAAAHCWLKHQ